MVVLFYGNLSDLFPIEAVLEGNSSELLLNLFTDL